MRVKFLAVVVLGFLLLVSLSPALALECVYGAAYPSADPERYFNGEYGPANVGAVGSNFNAYFQLSSLYYGGETILNRYYYDGSSWRPTTRAEDWGSGIEAIEFSKVFNTAKDYAVAAGWVYRDAGGQTRSIICNMTIRVLDRKVLSFGTLNASYPADKFVYGTPPTATKDVSDGGRLLYGVFVNSRWVGDNNGYSGNGWGLYLPSGSVDTDWGWAGGVGTTGAWSVRPWDHVYNPIYDVFGGTGQRTSVRFSIYAPSSMTPPAAPGADPVSSLDLNSLVIYSRGDNSCDCDIPTLDMTVNAGGIVYNETDGSRLSGATIDIHKVTGASCSGGHAGCGSTTVSAADGTFSRSCIRDDTEVSLLVIKVSNPAGYIDGSWPTATGCTGQSANRLCCPLSSFNTTINDIKFYVQCVPGVAPNQSTIISPAGTLANPIVLTGTTTATLRWNANADGVTDKYNYVVVGGAGANLETASTSVSFTGTYGIAYRWYVRAINEGCVDAYGPFSASGYFRFNRAPSGVRLTVADDHGTPVEVE